MPEGAIIGRYWPGTSPVHRMDARAKLLLSLAAMVAVFCAQGFPGLAAAAVFVAGFFLLSRIPLAKALKSIVPLIFVLVIAALFNLFFVQGGTVYIQWWFIQVSEDGVYMAAFMACRLLLLLLSMSLLTLTTTTIDITDAFERLLTPFARIGLPAHELSMMMGLALRFLPQFMLELKTVYQAQISRGARFASSPWKGGMHMISSLVVPLFTSAFRHAETLSLAMDARCYHGGPGRSRLHPLRFAARDLYAAAVLALMLGAVVACNILL